MGRTGSPRKPSPALRTLSNRIAPSLTFAPSPLSRSSLESSPAALPAPQSSSPMAPKRTIDEVEDPTTSTPKPNENKRQARRRAKPGKRDRIAARLGEEAEADAGEVEEGEVVEGDFSDLFMFDSTPSAVSKKNAYVSEPTADEANVKKEEEDVTGGEAEGNETLDETDIMKVFAREVAMTDGEVSSDDSEDEDGESSDEAEVRAPINIEGMMLYDDEEGLKEAIQGKIVDDSSAPVAGRYYKEADLTKSCVLCGEHGHSSRDCTHSQCFICGQIDVDHEARNCPVSLVCSACGSRGHFARDCDIAPGHGRYGSHHRCSICQSNNHSATNCSTLWRIYDVSGPKPQKRKIVCACANCGSTKDHFIDDCLLPRGHPMKYADSSAFNRQALGAAAASLPSYSAGGPTSSAASRRRNGGGGLPGGGYPGASASHSRSKRFEEDYESSGAGDDDWFASRARTAAGGSGGGRGAASSAARSSNWKGKGRGGGGGGTGTHIHFGGLSESSRDRFQGGGGGGDSASSSRSYRDDRAGNGSGYDSPRDRDRDSWKKSSYERSGDGGRGGSSSSSRRNSQSDRRAPSLLDRVGGSGKGGGGGGGSNRKPRYQGGYV